LDIGLKTSKESLDPPKYVDERILAGRDGLGRLREWVFESSKQWVERILTESKTPIPVKITPAGGYTCARTKIRP